MSSTRNSKTVNAFFIKWIIAAIVIVVVAVMFANIAVYSTVTGDVTAGVVFLFLFGAFYLTPLTTFGGYATGVFDRSE